MTTVGGTAPDPTELDATDSTTADPLAARVVERLRAAGTSIATAESLTGGLVCAALTSVPGASEVVCGGIASYTNELKSRVLGVPQWVLTEHGAVASQTALEMADGVRRLTGAGIGVATTGVAGPEPSEGKAVGTVFVAVTRESQREVRALSLHGSREQIRRQSVESALELVLDVLTGTGGR